MRRYPAVLALLALTACGDHQPPVQQAAPVWKTQMEMIEQAREIEGKIGEISARQRREIDQQTQ